MCEEARKEVQLCIDCSSYHCDKIPQKATSKGRAHLGSQFEAIVHPGREGTVAGVTYYVHNRETEK